MNKGTERLGRERMIHIRLNDNIHRELKILAARKNTSVQALVEDLIGRKVTKELGALKTTEGTRGRK